MKERFIELVNNIDEIEKLFHRTTYSPGFPSPDEAIYDVEEFQHWLQQITLVVQDIVDRTQDTFASDTLQEIKSSFSGWQDREDFNTIKGKLCAMKNVVDKYYISCTHQTELPPKIFISHSTDDKEYIKILVALFEDMGLDNTQVFCSSLPGYDIPIGKNILDYLREQFSKFKLHVVIVHSTNYYKSPVCLNEMGAAWVLRSNCTSFLLPNFEFSDMCGVVNNDAIAIKLDTDEIELKDKLNELYDMVASEFDLRKKAQITWEHKRDLFIKEIKDMGIEE